MNLQLLQILIVNLIKLLFNNYLIIILNGSHLITNGLNYYLIYYLKYLFSFNYKLQNFAETMYILKMRIITVE